MIRKYRAWFIASGYLGDFKINEKSDESITVNAHDAKDATWQAQLQLPLVLKDHPLGPFHQIAVWKVEPEEEQDINAAIEAETEACAMIVQEAFERERMWFANLKEYTDAPHCILEDLMNKIRARSEARRKESEERCERSKNYLRCF